MFEILAAQWAIYEMAMRIQEALINWYPDDWKLYDQVIDWEFQTRWYIQQALCDAFAWY